MNPAPAGAVAADLKAALAQDRCPCCRVTRLSDERRIWSYLYELTSDLPSRKLFDRSLGWCRSHANLAQAIASRQDMVNGARIARLYETAVMEYLDRLMAGSEGKRPPRFALQSDSPPVLTGSTCPTCAGEKDRQRANARTLAGMLLEESLRDRYLASEGLCIPHFGVVLSVADPATAAFLRKDHLGRMERLQTNLYSLQHKQNYDVHESTTTEEDGSWVEALWRFTGVTWTALLIGRRR
ncbi:MAG: DUF6062 family protein [Chloroflexota bacterium]